MLSKNVQYTIIVQDSPDRTLKHIVEEIVIRFKYRP